MANTIPIPTKTIIQLLTAALVIVTFIAGYFHAKYNNEALRYKKLEDLYVRVRSQLGREETQRLIDLSRKQDGSNKIYDW